MVDPSAQKPGEKIDDGAAAESADNGSGLHISFCSKKHEDHKDTKNDNMYCSDSKTGQAGQPLYEDSERIRPQF